MPLAAGQTLDVALFDVTVPTGTGLGTYTGSFGIQGGSTDGDYDLLADPQPFYVTTVSSAAPAPMPVPEASGSVAMLVGTLLTVGLIVAARRKKAVPAGGGFD